MFVQASVKFHERFVDNFDEPFNLLFRPAGMFDIAVFDLYPSSCNVRACSDEFFDQVRCGTAVRRI